MNSVAVGYTPSRGAGASNASAQRPRTQATTGPACTRLSLRRILNSLLSLSQPGQRAMSLPWICNGKNPGSGRKEPQLTVNDCASRGLVAVLSNCACGGKRTRSETKSRAHTATLWADLEKLAHVSAYQRYDRATRHGSHCIKALHILPPSCVDSPPGTSPEVSTACSDAQSNARTHHTHPATLLSQRFAHAKGSRGGACMLEIQPCCGPGRSGSGAVWRSATCPCSHACD